MNQLKLGIDIDGCITDTFSEWLNHYNLITCDTKTLEDMYDYDLCKVFNIPSKLVYDLFALMDDRKLELLDPNCPKVLDELIADGYTIDLVTAHIPNELTGQKNLLEVLDKHEIHYHNIKYVDVHDVGAKAQIAHQYDFMVDDSPSHITSFIGKTKPILYVQPYTKSFYEQGVMNAYSWTDVRDIIYHYVDGFMDGFDKDIK